MLQKIFNTNIGSAYEACKRALREYRCEEVYGDYRAGIIEARRHGNLRAGDRIVIRMNDHEPVVITVSVSGLDDENSNWDMKIRELQESVVLELISLRLT